MQNPITAASQNKLAASTNTYVPSTAVPKNRRRVLCLYPRYTKSFGTMHHSYKLMPGVTAFMPPQGILVIAAYLPKEWDVRFIDESVQEAKDSDYAWCDAVFMSGMHVQRENIGTITRRAHEFDKLAILGGPSVSGCPEWYTDVDILHCGELGDATDQVIARLDESTERPERQEIFRTINRLPLCDFPLPAYHFIDITKYFLGSVQWSSGCPYRCEFCDIPELYGRNPRLKSPKQVTAELDAMLARANPGAVYFVDDNFIGNQKAAVELLTELVAWQKLRGYPLQFAIEGTLNLSKNKPIMELMREANIVTCFCGIETPEEDALKFIHKEQNLRQPILESIREINSYGIEIVSGIILGLDTDTPETGKNITTFIGASQIPMLTINMLHALPKTPLFRRLEAADRLVKNPGDRESNVEFLMPYQTVVDMWLGCVSAVYTPEAICDRFHYQIDNVFPRRMKLPNTKARINYANIKKAVQIIARIFWYIGIKGDYRKTFWKMAWHAIRKGDIEALIHCSAVAHHMILFARECASGEAEKCFYADGDRAAQVSPTKASVPTPARMSA
jgi:radical SAM superfamily enzyme YgiQ (UPF0313 family)